MIKTKNILAIISAIFSIFLSILFLLKYYNLDIGLFNFLITKNEVNERYFLSRSIFNILNTLLSILIIFKNNKKLSIIFLILSIINYNVLSMIAAILSIIIINDLEKRYNNESKIENKIELKNNQFEGIEIDDTYNIHFKISIVLLSFYLIIYVALIILYIIYNYKDIDAWINPVTAAKNLGPGAIALIFIYPFMLIAFLIIVTLLYIPLVLMIIGIKLNKNALKKDCNSYYKLKYYGIINLTFINSYRANKIINEIAIQKSNQKS